MVERGGHHASIAQDGVDALEALQQGPFDVMLLDLGMPRMDGMEVVRWLREHPDIAPGLQIVVVSAWVDQHRAELQNLDIDEVMVKPVSLKQIRDVITRAGASKLGG